MVITISTYEHILAKPHCYFERDFISLCKESGYKVTDLSYHHNYKPEVMASLRADCSPASLSIRLSPDMMVSKGDKTFFVELKTGNHEDKIQVEAYQLMLNQIREKYSCVPCLYVYRGDYTHDDTIACYASDIVPNTLVIPNVDKNRYIKPILEEYFTCEKMQKKMGSRFSADAYIEINDLRKWEPIDSFIN